MREGTEHGHLSSWVLIWATWSGLFYGNFEAWLKGALEVELLYLLELYEGNPKGGLPCSGTLGYK
jgi:hypothetical protein